MTIRVFDEATKKALVGLLPLAPGSYITTGLDCFDHLAPADRPLFRIRDLSAEQFTAMRSAVRGGGTVDPATMVKALQEGAMGPWEGVPDSNFNEIPFSTEAIARLPFLWIEAFYWKCAALCSPNKAEREVLELPQPSTSESSSKIAADAAVPLD